MPAIITHDQFGQEVYHDLYASIGGSRDEADAFLLGNQGPDPLFFSFLSPRLLPLRRFASRMHRERPNELLAGFKRALGVLNEQERSVGRAYALGFLCHYLLDSTLHPFVYAQENALCSAGVEGLDERSHSEVHAVIETDFDEIVLFTRRGETVATYNPSRQILKASASVLNTVSKMYAYVALTVYDVVLPPDAFATSVKNFRIVQGAFYSRLGLKREALLRAELLVRRHSMYGAMSHRARESAESPFDNRSRAPWRNPFTGETSTSSFWDGLECARSQVEGAFSLFDQEGFDACAAARITGNRDFSGRPADAVLVSVDDVRPGC